MWRTPISLLLPILVVAAAADARTHNTPGEDNQDASPSTVFNAITPETTPEANKTERFSVLPIQLANRTAGAAKHIASGILQTEPWDSPWYVFLGNCGGALIDPLIVLTAAHCIDVATQVPDVVLVGPKQQAVQIKGWALHPAYDAKSAKVDWNFNHIKNDVGVIILQNPVTYVRPIHRGAAPPVGTKVLIQGRGARNEAERGSGNLPAQIHYGYATISTYDGEMHPQMIYAIGDRSKTDSSMLYQACPGDSGTALVHGNILVGVTSSSSENCGEFGESYFTRVDWHQDWLDAYVKKYGRNAPLLAPLGCSDRSRTCIFWAQNGECSKNEAYMTTSCKLACQLCSGTLTPAPLPPPPPKASGGCKNHNEDCQYWAQTGECAKNPDYMQINCPLSCDWCSGTGTTRPSPPPPQGTNQCAAWTYTKIKGYRLVGKNRIRTFPSGSLAKCGTACIANKNCYSYNYLVSSRSCTLYRGYFPISSMRDSRYYHGYLACVY